MNKTKFENLKKNKKYSKFNLFKVKGEINYFLLIVNILIPLIGSFLIGFINRNSMDMYKVFNKPIFSPPPIIFSIVWPILYILMGIAAYRINLLNRKGIDDRGGCFFYLIQLFLNFMWTFIFFAFRLYGIGFMWLVILVVFIIITIIKFIQVDKISAILLLPYLLWCLFASVLSFYVWMLNEM